jgi:hypothetical protein
MRLNELTLIWLRRMCQHHIRVRRSQRNLNKLDQVNIRLRELLLNWDTGQTRYIFLYK